MRYALIVFAMLIGGTCIGQKESSFKDRLYYGGGVQASFGNQTIVVGASPIVGYKWTEKFSTGIGVSFVYFRLNSPFGRFQSSVYGANAFARHMFLDNFFAQLEYHRVNSDVPVIDQNTGSVEQGRQWMSLLYVGAGYRASLGGNIFATLVVLYDILEEPLSPYSNPAIRGGIAIGL